MARQNKTQPNQASVTKFISEIGDEHQRQDAQWLLEMMQVTTDAEPVMWGSSIVGFGNNSYRTSDGVERDWFYVGFSPRKGKLSLYLMTGFDEYAEHADFDPQPYLDRLGPHKTGKACLYIKRLSDIDTDVLKEFVTVSYEHQTEVGG